MSLIASQHQSRIPVKINLTISLGISWKHTSVRPGVAKSLPANYAVTGQIASRALLIKSSCFTRGQLEGTLGFVRASTKPKAVDARNFITKDGRDLRRRCSRSYPVDIERKAPSTTHRATPPGALLPEDSPPRLATKFAICRHQISRVSPLSLQGVEPILLCLPSCPEGHDGSRRPQQRLKPILRNQEG